MAGYLTIFDIMKTILFWMSPIVFLLGLSLIFLTKERYEELEKILDKEMGLKKKLIPQIETNIYIFHKWLLGKRLLLGIFLIIYSIILFIVLRK